MTTIVVGGTGKHVGKTALICGLIAALAEFRWIAVKITPDAHGKPSSIWEETRAGEQTDTARYLAAGARRALLVSVAAGESLEHLMAKIKPGADVIFESNRILEFMKPDVCLMVNGGDAADLVKQSFELVVEFADAMVRRSNADRVEDQSLKPVFYLGDMERVSPEMLAWVRLKLGEKI